MKKIHIHNNAAFGKIFLTVLAAYGIGLGGYTLLVLLAYAFGRLISSFLMNLLGNSLYYILTDLAPYAAVGIGILLFLGITAVLIWRPHRQIQQVLNATKHLLDENGELPRLPSDLKDVEMSLQATRLAYLRSRQQAKEAEQRKNDLVVYLAHDLKTPLTSVIGYLSLLEECPDLPPEQRAKYVSITVDKAYRLEQLINEFFDITRFNLQSVVLEKGKLDLSLLLRQLAEEFEPMLTEKNLSLTLRIEEGVQIVADGDKLARVFDNLLRNAISYSYPDSVIQIAAQCVGGTATVDIRNVGDEIPPEKLERVFEKFFRADSSRASRSGGSGLGLAIAKQIAELHGGTITAQSNVDFTEFSVNLPVC